MASLSKEWIPSSVLHALVPYMAQIAVSDRSYSKNENRTLIDELPIPLLIPCNRLHWEYLQENIVRRILSRKEWGSPAL